MTKQQKITLSASRDIPFNKLMLSQSNVRHVKAGVSIEELAEEDSLAENVQRAPLHPLDQFRAFQAMRKKGRTEEEIAAAFFVPASVVKQRLKLAAVAPSLLDAYAEEEMTLDQLMAFTVTIGRTGEEIVRQQLAVPPTLTIRPNFPVRVMVTRDLILEPLGEVR